MSIDKDWEEFVDDVADAEFEWDDLSRVVNEREKGIDEFDAQRVLSDLCSLRYRCAFTQMALTAINLVARPAADYKKSIRNIRRARDLLDTLAFHLKRIGSDGEKDDDKEKDEVPGDGKD